MDLEYHEFAMPLKGHLMMTYEMITERPAFQNGKAFVKLITIDRQCYIPERRENTLHEIQ